ERRLDDRREAGPRPPARIVHRVEGATVSVGRLHQAGSEKPPSTTIVWPHTIAASGEQRNETVAAMSSASTRRPAGVRSTERSISSLFGKWSSAPVSTTPPDTAFTRTAGASSTAR